MTKPMEEDIRGVTSDSFSRALLDWYGANARPLPWRQTTDPYAIWVSEVMLQQTRVETVIPYYHRFLERFPTIAALAEAPEAEVLKEWEGLGYYRRARLLQQGVREVAASYGGQVPDDPDALRKLPGVGPYMAGSLSGIAFNRPVPAVDGNVIRVVTRVLAWPEDAFTAKAQRMIAAWVRERFIPGRARDFTQSLMELGALICLPRNPRCPDCPVRAFCKGAAGDPETYPVKRTGRPVPAERRVALRIDWNGRRLLLQRPAKGLLAEFWEYPNLLAASDAGSGLGRAWTAQWLGRGLEFRFLKAATQIFSHRRWDLEIWEAAWDEPEIAPLVPPRGAWFFPEDERKLARVAFVRELDSGA